MIGPQLRKARQEQDLNQAAVAAEAGITQQWLSLIELDQAPGVTVSTLQRVAAALGKRLVITLVDADGAAAQGAAA